ncbi:hypothetical protein GN244_ATG13332 [Phytophthora infestans]|uniref:Uncharacterized protein n=1 Tax=Phytophthora infestans TaxID=4787 RepID=A0A833T6Q6_PHYIN|nr:hypothetical protein GN244_ATG13332 [Phytophthora infestans]KAF4142404.1 hypothetical protein GN958_ATG08580 [Phytophthora infestans]
MGNIASCYKTSKHEPCTPALDDNQAVTTEPDYKPQVEEEVDRPVIKEKTPPQDSSSDAAADQPKPPLTASSPLLSRASSQGAGGSYGDRHR